jgi:hypothetical protein
MEAREDFLLLAAAAAAHVAFLRGSLVQVEQGLLGLQSSRLISNVLPLQAFTNDS